MDAKNNMKETGEWLELSPEDKRYINKILREYIQDGILLTPH